MIPTTEETTREQKETEVHQETGTVQVIQMGTHNTLTIIFHMHKVTTTIHATTTTLIIKYTINSKLEKTENPDQMIEIQKPTTNILIRKEEITHHIAIMHLTTGRKTI